LKDGPWFKQGLIRQGFVVEQKTWRTPCYAPPLIWGKTFLKRRTNHRGGKHMPDVMDIAKKALLTGIGLALTAKDEAEDLAKELEKKLNLTEGEGKKFLKDIQNRYEDTQNKLEERIEKSVKKFLKKADIVTSDELKALKKEIRDLKESINKNAGAGGD
jgi:polyhydroxyalkanoate synthesis regulator phasin